MNAFLDSRRAWLALLGLALLRVVIGLHFFSEGASKVREGDFRAASFLRQAQGPLAGFYHGMIDDYDGRIRLNASHASDGKPNADLAVAIWRDYVNQVADECDFDNEQKARADKVADTAENRLRSFLAVNEVEIVAWLGSGDRVEGFARDGSFAKKAAVEITGFRDQIDEIASQRAASASGWFAEVESIWDNFETSIAEIARGGNAPPELIRPWAPTWSPNRTIDLVIPWFDLAVGFLLVVGLYSRIAALAGIGLLIGIVLAQPFWVPGTADTWFQWIEMTGLAVIAVTAAGRFGGLDYFLMGNRRLDFAAEESDA